MVPKRLPRTEAPFRNGGSPSDSPDSPPRGLDPIRATRFRIAPSDEETPGGGRDGTGRSIGDLAREFGLSRGTLLHYDRIGLLSPSRRTEAGYRVYGAADRDRLARIRAYRASGLSLRAIGEALDREENRSAAPPADLVERRLREVERELRTLRGQREILRGYLHEGADRTGEESGRRLWLGLLRAAGIEGEGLRRWHREFERRSPEGHQDFLASLGLSEKEILWIRRLSMRMDDNERYMRAFLAVFEGVLRQGPGEDTCTERAWRFLAEREGFPERPEILDAGCGSGAQSLLLARLCGGARIRALDFHAPFLATLRERAEKEGTLDRIRTVEGSIAEMPFEDGAFDVVWSEGALFTVGFARGVREARRCLRPGGYLAASELAWLTPDPPEEVAAYFGSRYPAMLSREGNRSLIESQGFRVQEDFVLPERAWLEEYYAPLEDRIAQVRPGIEAEGDPAALRALRDLSEEIDVYRRFREHYGYVLYLARREG